MPIVANPVSTSQPYIPGIQVAQLGRFPGFAVCFPTIAALTDAVAVERANIVATSALWFNGQPMAIADEAAQGVGRVWSDSAQHARTAILRPGVGLVLDADSNVVLFGSGAPSNGSGANGDGYLSTATGNYYKRAAGVWGLLGTVAIRAAARTATLAYAATVTVDTDAYDAVTVAPATGALVLNLSGAPANHQTVRVELQQDAVGGRVFTLGAAIQLPTGVAAVEFDTRPGRSTLLAASYMTSQAKWVLVSAMPGI